MLRLVVVLCMPLLVLCQVDINQLGNYEFNRFDLNQDGNLQPLEIQTYLNRFDTNHDSRISRQEWAREVETHHVNNPQAHEVLMKLFDALDFDNDNHVDGPDYNDVFAAADTNHNNLVTQPEFLTYFYDLTGLDPVVVGK